MKSLLIASFVTVKVLYTFDDQNKTNCLARGPDVLQIKTVSLDETTSIGIIELRTCIEAVIQCSPEIVARLGEADYTVYAYDYSEYDNPLVGQGMLSRALAASSPTPDTPAQSSQKLITGRVCKNILGLFNNGIKETLEVKLRLVPVPIVMQGEYLSAMERYKGLNKSPPAEFDSGEWAALMASKAAWLSQNASGKRGSVNMEVVNQLLSPSLQPQPQPQQQPTPVDQFNDISNAINSESESREISENTGKANTSRPSSRASVKRPRGRGRSAKPAITGGNTSGYEDGTDGDDGPVSKKRAKITKTDWNSKSSFGPATDSLRVAASTAGSLRVFRPIAMNPAASVGGNHLQEIPRAPTPVPILPKQQIGRGRAPSQSTLRRESFLYQNEAPRQHISPYPPLQPSAPPEDQVRLSVESAGPSPERNISPVETPPGIGSSPPVMRTCSPMRSSPPCPSSPILPQMPRTDSGFMSGSMDELFGEDDEVTRPVEDEDIDNAAKYKKGRKPREDIHHGFVIEEETPGPMELLPTRMPTFKQKSAPKPPKSRAGSVLSEDGQQSLPRLKIASQAPSRRRTPSNQDADVTVMQSQDGLQTQDVSQAKYSNQPSLPEPEQETQPQPIAPQPPIQSTSATAPAPVQPPSRPGSRMMVRTASMGSLTLPTVPASDPVLPPSSLQRSQTWSEAQHPVTEAPMPTQTENPEQASIPMQLPSEASGVPYSRTLNAKKAAIKQKLEQAIANGEMPPFCSNCGAIETPTWRKAWSQDHRGAPGYYEYSDEPGRVTAIVILGRNNEGQPNSYQLVKKFLGPSDSQADWNEFLLCNRKLAYFTCVVPSLIYLACGIWLSKYKSQRPEEKWESNRYRPDKNVPDRKPNERKRSQRPSKSKKANGNAVPTSEANCPPSEVFPQLDNFLPPNIYTHTDAFFPQSEAYHPLSEMPGQCVSPLEPLDPTQQQLDFQVHRVELHIDQELSNSSHSRKQSNDMTTDAASATLKRAIQSSPGRWVGTQHSPIDVDDGLGSTRRLLFPSPRKDGSPKVLGELTTNIVNISGDATSPKEQTAGGSDKENSPSGFDVGDTDADLIKLFEAEISRPKTPVQKSPAPNPFKTPTRPTPNHRPITRSVSKSLRSGKSPRQLFPFSQKTPSRTPGSINRRRSPRNHQSIFESPFTATLNQLMSEDQHKSTPQRCNFDLDFNQLSDLPIMDNPGHHGGMNFSLEDFFSTDVPMPSSPPKTFHLYEDPMTMTDVDWNEFHEFQASPMRKGSGLDRSAKAVRVKEEPDDIEERGKLTQHSQPSEEQIP